jgi:thiol-disulfide isomerase/thioredoxin
MLEPKTWIGEELPILKHIDIADQLRVGTWLVLFYHHGCPKCRKAIPQYQRMAKDLMGEGDFLRIALIEIPPYGPIQSPDGSSCAMGRLADVKEWLVTTPAAVLISNARVGDGWEAEAPDPSTILTRLQDSERSNGGACGFESAKATP